MFLRLSLKNARHHWKYFVNTQRSAIYEGVDRGGRGPLPPPSRPLVSLLPSGAARASRALNFPLSPSLPSPSPSSRHLFSLLPPPLLPPPSPSPPPSHPLFSPLPLTLSAPSYMYFPQYFKIKIVQLFLDIVIELAQLHSDGTYICTSPDTKFWPTIGYPRHWVARGVLHADCILHSHMVRRTADGQESNLRLSDQESKVLHDVFCVKISGNVLAPDPCLKWIICPRARQIFISPPPPPSGFNGRPLSTLYIGALVIERSFAELGILHHPLPLYMRGYFLSHPSRLNENGHQWMKNIWPNFRQKTLLLKCADQPPHPLNKMVVSLEIQCNITTTATRHWLNGIWIHRSQEYFKKFPSVSSAVLAPRLP